MSEIEDCSVEARYWIKGFLAGCEPDAPKDEEGDYLPEDGPAYQRWREAIKQFPEKGFWFRGERECEICHAQLLPTESDCTHPQCAKTMTE